MVNPIKCGQPDHYMLVVDTNQYAANIALDLCAYMTGIILGAEEEFVKKKTAAAIREVPKEVKRLEDLVTFVSDEYGTAPYSIFPNPRYGNDGDGNHALLTSRNTKEFPWPAYNSVAIFFNSVPNSKLLKVLKERAEKFVKYSEFARREGLKIEGFRFLEQRTTYKELDVL